jgi:hypothetical protein
MVLWLNEILAFLQKESLPRAQSVGSEAASELLQGLEAEIESGGVPGIERWVTGTS